MAEILHDITETLPGSYVFDVVTSNFKALERVSRSEYRLVCFAEDSGSALDGRKAATVFRRVRKGREMAERQGGGEGNRGGREKHYERLKIPDLIDFSRQNVGRASGNNVFTL